HADHTGGVAALVARHRCPVYGPRADPIKGIDHPLGDGDRVVLDDFGIGFEVIAVPGHPLTHIAYDGNRAAARDPRGALHCGQAGWGILPRARRGALLAGTRAQVQGSLARRGAPPDDPLADRAPDFPRTNLRLARGGVRGEAAVAERLAEARAVRERAIPTVP